MRGQGSGVRGRAAACGFTRRRGFTLVELLITVTIIAILASFVAGGLFFSRQTARTARTKATITKINHYVMRQYESYMTRPVPIDTTGMTSRQAAEARLRGLRELMRMEMPDRWSDVIDDVHPDLATLGLARPAISHYFYAQALNAKGQAAFGENSHAECLYMFVMANPEARETFSQQEIGDIDGDGLMEFHDGWGNPIYFLRWAPAFSYDPAYANPSMPTLIQSGNPETDPDPFDPMRVQPTVPRLIPLIYSGGPSARYRPTGGGGGNAWNFDINTGQNLSGRNFPDGYQDVGGPTDAHGDGLHYHDNITNHLMEQK